ncbi:MAG: alpha/beta fold hydrolase BchO [Burkholderiales bacterium]
MAADRLDWARDGRDWPHREASRFVDAGGLRWHVQHFGADPQAPLLLLLHGTGAATHSWRGLAPRLAASFRVIAPDLPGHGFTDLPAARGLSLPGMAESVGALLAVLGVSPDLVVGHSAGAAIGARMTLDGRCAPRGLVGLNPAFVPFGGVPGQLFSPAARWLGGLSAAPRLFARIGASPVVLDRLLRGTGSEIGADGRRAYATLVTNPGHVAGALGMMARWDLRPLERELPRLPCPLLMIVGARDLTVPPDQAHAIADRVPGALVETLAGLGHLAHEERPDQVSARICAFAARLGLPAARCERAPRSDTLPVNSA